MVVFDLSPQALAAMTRVDLAKVDKEPTSPIGPFDFHGCICGVASFSGQPPWELHTTGDELLHVLSGESELTILENGTRLTRLLHAGDVVVVPNGCWHNNRSPSGVVMLYLTPREGGRHSWTEPTNEIFDSARGASG